MNRDRYIERIVVDEGELAQLPEGTQESVQLGVALAATTSRDLMRAILEHKGAIDQFGGEFYVAAVRRKMSGGMIVDASRPGNYETVGYVISYSKKAQIKGQEPDPDVDHVWIGTENRAEPDVPRATEEPPDLVAVEANGEPG